jgi:hypothetical protein
LAKAKARFSNGIAQVGTEQPSIPTAARPRSRPVMLSIVPIMRCCTGWRWSV